ncbi:MAG: helix-turn-helix transcriptional regulator [Anaerocolumna aminovalerica]|uniref:helix-turn-helix domain-containing protein n=1 Tax=Anaerocolumna aminovalerica TaxID=1527 RepID=UPI002906A7A8|nr:helix-turn-helix transcriptional regulator [Anaerocolumna aminovalerica]MDU6265822.1 helix-turn-helix transcriptional regulator [Anaerocolumna aminovalerica]
MKISVDTSKLFIAMAEKGYNGADLAKACGLPVSSVSNVMNGTRRGTTKVLGLMCKGLDLSVKDVIIIED